MIVFFGCFGLGRCADIDSPQQSDRFVVYHFWQWLCKNIHATPCIVCIACADDGANVGDDSPRKRKLNAWLHVAAGSRKTEVLNCLWFVLGTDTNSARCGHFRRCRIMMVRQVVNEFLAPQSFKRDPSPDRRLSGKIAPKPVGFGPRRRLAR